MRSERNPEIEKMVEQLERMMPERESDKHCRTCGEHFSKANTFTTMGWRETAISGHCEKCFDLLFSTPGGEIYD